MAEQADQIPSPRRSLEPANKGRNDETHTETEKKLPELAQRFFRESPGRRGSFRLVVDRMYAAHNGSISMEFDFSEEVLRRALLNIYSRTSSGNRNRNQPVQ